LLAAEQMRLSKLTAVWAARVKVALAILAEIETIFSKLRSNKSQSGENKIEISSLSV